MEATTTIQLCKNLLLKIHVILFLLKNNYQQLGGIFMYTQTRKNETNKQKTRIFEKFSSDFSAYRVFPDGTKNANMATDAGTSANTNLKRMSNDQLLLQTKNLVQKERQINIQVLQHLQEIEKRKLYLKRGFPSLFEYAIKELDYSHSAAYRRIKAMRLCRDIPQATSKIKTGSLNLTTASQLQTFFEKKKRKDKKQALDAIKTPTANNPELCNVQSTFLPAAGCVKEGEEQDKKTPVKLDSNHKLDLIKKAEGKSSRELEKTLFDIDPEVSNEREKVRDITNNRVEIKVILNKESQQKLEALKKLLSHKNPNMSYGELISLLAEMGLNKYDPKRKINKKNCSHSRGSGNPGLDACVLKARFGSFQGHDNNHTKVATSTRMKTNAKVITGAERRANTKIIKPQKASEQTTKQKINNNQKNLKHTRYIPSVVRHHVWMRDQGQCAYVCSKTKRRCSSNHLLQIDHIKPFSLGGTNEVDNLRLLCANHNQFTFSRYQKFL